MRSSLGLHLCIVVALLVAGCSAASTPPAETGASRESAQDKSPHTAASAPIEGEPAAGPLTEDGSEVSHERPNATASSWKIILSQSEEFLSALLPAPRPERYRSFREISRIHVGRSHLDQVDLFPDEQLLLAMSSAEATVRVYDRQTKRLLGNHAVPSFTHYKTGSVFAWPEGPPRFLAATPRGLLLVDALAGNVLATLDEHPFGTLRWSPDRRLLVARESHKYSEHTTLHFFARTAAPADREGKSAQNKPSCS